MRQNLLVAMFAIAVTNYLYANSEIVDGVEWRYYIDNGVAVLGTGGDSQSAISRAIKSKVSIPAMLGECPVTCIGSCAFYDCKMSEIDIPSSVTNIDSCAFRCCENLQTILIPKGIRRINNSSFEQCNALSSVVLPESLEYIDACAFSHCPTLSSVNIPSAVIWIGDRAFYNCGGLGTGIVVRDGWLLTVNGLCPSDVAILSGTKGIAGGAFFQCRDLLKLVIPEGVQMICDCAFYECSFLNSLKLPSSIVSIGGSAFQGCYSLTHSIDIHAKSIGGSAFQGCRFSDITVAYGIEKIGDYAFAGCECKSVTIPSSTTILGNSIFAYCSNLQSINIPGDTKLEAFIGSGSSSCVRHVGYSAGSTIIRNDSIYYGNEIESISIPEGISAIGGAALYHCNDVTNLVIPKSVRYIETIALPTNLETIFFKGRPPVDAAYILPKSPTQIFYNNEYSEEWLKIIKANNISNISPFTPSDDDDDPSDDYPDRTNWIAVKFNALSGECSTNHYVYLNGRNYGVLPSARRDGCTFAGWYTDDGKQVTAYSLVDPNVKCLYSRWVEDSVSLYAKWSPNTYSIVFDANGGKGTMANDYLVYDSSKMLSSNLFTRIGYSFIGWSTNATGEVAYANNESVSNLTIEVDGSYVLYAMWKKMIPELTGEQVEDWLIDELAPQFASKHGMSSAEYRKVFKEKFGSDFAVAFEKQTGKLGFDDSQLCVWHDYVAGTDPLDEDSVFTAKVNIVDGEPKITWEPDLNEKGTKNIRKYVTSGKMSLLDKGWTAMDSVPVIDKSKYHFFKVSVEMP